MLSSPLLSKLSKYIKEELWPTHTPHVGREDSNFSAPFVETLCRTTSRLNFFPDYEVRVYRCVGDRVPVRFYLTEQESAINSFAGSTAVEVSFARLLR